MTKIDVFSGFLGAGKTTLIKKLIKEAYAGEKLVLIENEFGEIGIDGGFLQEAGINITEMNSGCICCSLVGDFAEALSKVLQEYSPDRILIEPSGVGKLSDVIRAVGSVLNEDVVLNSYTAVCDVNKYKMYMKNFSEFFADQIDNAKAVVLSRTSAAEHEKTERVIELIKQRNGEAVIVSTPWEQLDGKQILDAIQHTDTLEGELERMERQRKRQDRHHEHDEDCDCGHHHDHHHEHDEDCDCGHRHDHHHEHDEDCDCGHHHEHDEDCDCGHHHEHDEDCDCGHHNHHAEEVFTSWGKETPKKITEGQILKILGKIENSEKYGMVLRAKGIVQGEDGKWIHFDYVPGELDVRVGSPSVIGRICVIGSKLNQKAIEELFEF